MRAVYAEVIRDALYWQRKRNLGDVTYADAVYPWQPRLTRLWRQAYDRR